ncbi:MAG: type II secretion system F family protein [Hyphomicrobiales bacterium]|nr:type II secretion system F family protein [Hyphomicrobiales bacterium]
MPTEGYELTIYLMVGIAVFLGVEVLYLSIARRATYLRQVNARLKLLQTAADSHDVLLELRRRRSLSAEGAYVLPAVWFNRLVMQSGIGVGIWKLLMLMGLAALLGFAITLSVHGSLLLAAGGAVFAGVLMPLFALRFLRQRRRKKFEGQLPDAIDIMVRSLRAGHPLPVAIAMVGREQQDPIGSEFGLTADEMTYGLDLETAMNNMSQRVGLDDLTLVVVAISIQSKTGGNLSEILSNLSSVVRARFKLRRRVKALSAEGRFSALFLSALPFLIFGGLYVISPNYYGDVWHEPIVFQVLAGTGLFMLIGNVIMHRMCNFKM